MKVSSLAGIAICASGFSPRIAIAQLLSNAPKQGRVGVRGGEYVPGGGRRAMGEDYLNLELESFSLMYVDAGDDEPAAAALVQASADAKRGKFFTRAATFPVCKLLDPTCNTNTSTNAEIVTVMEDGSTAVFTDSLTNAIGFVDISIPSDPKGLGRFIFGTGKKPTGVATKGNFALVCVETGTVPSIPSGYLAVIDASNLTNLSEVKQFDLGGQPDSIFVSPDKKYAVAVIENRRSDDGTYPQNTTIPGFIAIFDISGEDPATDWVKRPNVALTNLPGLRFEYDPEPEYASISDNNIAAVTLQENNAVVFINITDGKVVQSIHAGAVNLKNVDLKEDKMIVQTETQDLRRREPDGVAWIGTRYIITANEGDLDGGSRGFTIFDSANGNVIYESNMSAEHLITSFGHYNDKRSRTTRKGVEFESVVYASDLGLAFVLSERSSVIMVYDVSTPSKPKFHQVLPSCVAPEGGYYVKRTQVLVVACEEDNRREARRSSLAVYKYGSNGPAYPTIQSVQDEATGVPIPWGALSGLSAPHSGTKKVLYSVDDSVFIKSKIFTIDTTKNPPKITKSMYIKDTDNVLANFNTTDTAASPIGFTATELALLINSDKTVNLDQEGIVAVVDGFWIAHEGAGSKPDVGSLNLLIKVNTTGIIKDVVSLPNGVNGIQTSNGFEGVTKEGDYLIVAFQREWGGEARVRLGLYNLINRTWKFVYYPLDRPQSQFGDGWVGLSDVTNIGRGNFLLVERDNRAGPDAAIKRIYKISLGELDTIVDGTNVTKTLYQDILPDVSTKIGGLALEKVEGMALLNGYVWVGTDNDGTDNTSGESRLIKLGKLRD